MIKHTEKRKEAGYSFPKIMESSKNIVLFSENKVGVVLVSKTGASYPGRYSDTWAMEKFTDYQGGITLWNEE